MMPPSADTYGRLRLALMTHDSTPDDYDTVMDAWRGTDRDQAVTFEDLPDDVQALVEGLEQSAPTTSPQGQLHARLGDTMSRDMSPDENDAIVDAVLAAGPQATWDDLPQDTRELIEQVEEEVPRTAWDDPDDAPDDTSYMDAADDDVTPVEPPNPPYVVPVLGSVETDAVDDEPETDDDNDAADEPDGDEDDQARSLAVVHAGERVMPASVEDWTDEDIARAFEHDTTPGHNQLKHYWLAGPGLAKWADTEDPWTQLHAELSKYLPPEEAKKTASQWFHDHFGFWPGSDLNRVTHGKPPRGKVVGPG